MQSSRASGDGAGVRFLTGLVRHLRQQPRPLYAVLDAARDERVLGLLSGSGEEHQSLYEGLGGQKLALWAPYLVRLPRQSPFLDTLVHEGWGKSWGIYLTGGPRLRDVRRHLRRFLMVKTANGKKLYFRFYDPRVLRAFLPTCTPRQTTMLFGEVESYLVEARRSATLLTFTLGHSDVVTGEVRFDDEGD